ncbi:LAETG motif-containing sortase-dependent surface protein [Streptomyces sp. NPDC001262]|uniref:LAETG motif-containing sortase-dependent surface protein n=1 Tax=Streptomyces sp. NPDC001262 TaxID=3364552 RepID=UPI0036B703E2
MKLSRIATVAAAVSLAPAVFLATPALADDGNTVQPPAQTATGQQAGGPAAQTEQEAKAVLTFPDLPKKLVAGAKDWTEFSFIIDNTKGKAVEEFSLSFVLNDVFDNKDHSKADKSELEYQGADTKWRSVYKPSAYGSVFGEVKDGKLEKGEKRTIKLRIRLDAAFPAHPEANVMVEASGVTNTKLPHIAVEAQPASPSPDPSTHGGEKSNKPTESSSPIKPSPSDSPAPSASPSASASASASPSPAPATGGDNTASGSGDTTQLAATGAGNETPWLIGGSAAALVAGTGMVVAARRRSASRG